MVRCLLWASLLVGLCFAPPTFAADITGKARVIDGDTIEILGQRIRLHGIDTPESKQTCQANGKAWQCGQEATFALAEAIGRSWVECERKDTDRYGRMVAVCRVGGPKGRDLNAYMVAEGWALAYRKYSKNYVKQEDAARTAGKGLWRGKFMAPWDWRRRNR